MKDRTDDRVPDLIKEINSGNFNFQTEVICRTYHELLEKDVDIYITRNTNDPSFEPLIKHTRVENYHPKSFVKTKVAIEKRKIRLDIKTYPVPNRNLIRDRHIRQLESKLDQKRLVELKSIYAEKYKTLTYPSQWYLGEVATYFIVLDWLRNYDHVGVTKRIYPRIIKNRIELRNPKQFQMILHKLFSDLSKSDLDYLTQYLLEGKRKRNRKLNPDCHQYQLRHRLHSLWDDFLKPAIAYRDFIKLILPLFTQFENSTIESLVKAGKS
jgi:hypothetical protein